VFAVGGNFQYVPNGFATRWFELTNQNNGDFPGPAASGLGADSCGVYLLLPPPTLPPIITPPVTMVVHPSDTVFFAPITVAPRGQGAITAPRVVVDATRVFWADSGEIYRALKPQ
jgi:hypothetical protein